MSKEPTQKQMLLVERVAKGYAILPDEVDEATEACRVFEEYRASFPAVECGPIAKQVLDDLASSVRENENKGEI